jgi:hypothetical protein
MPEWNVVYGRAVCQVVGGGINMGAGVGAEPEAGYPGVTIAMGGKCRLQIARIYCHVRFNDP